MLLLIAMLELGSLGAGVVVTGSGIVITGSGVVVTGVGVFIITGVGKGVFAAGGAAFKRNSTSSIQKSP